MSGKTGHHRDAIHGAGRQAQFATGAFAGDHRVHQLARAHDGIHRAGIDAFAATDTECFINDGAGARFVHAVSWIEWLGREMQQSGQRLQGDIAAWRTLIDAGGAVGERFGIGPTARITALRALRLRQPGVDLVNGNGRAHGRRVWPRFTIQATTATVCWQTGAAA